MKTMFYSVIVVFLCGIAGTNLYAQKSTDVNTDKQKMAQLERMADAIDLEGLILDKFAEGMEEGMGDMGAQGLPDDFGQVFLEKMTENFVVDEFLTEVIAPVLNEYFTLDDMKLVADFVESDLGRELITAKMNDEEFDVQAKLKSGEVEEADAVKAMQLFVRFGARQDEFAKIGAEIEVRATQYGERIAMETISEMMEDYMEDTAE